MAAFNLSIKLFLSSRTDGQVRLVNLMEGDGYVPVTSAVETAMAETATSSPGRKKMTMIQIYINVQPYVLAILQLKLRTATLNCVSVMVLAGKS